MNLRSIYLLFLPSLLLAGCGVSPILQHHEESRGTSATATVQKIASASVTIRWLSGPKEGGCSFKLESNQPFALEDAWAEMPDMGHGTTPFTIHVDSETEITVSDVWFTMPGSWRVFLKTAEATTSFDVEVQ